jgi:Fic-DOC domain mobile mystery protein B
MTFEILPIGDGHTALSEEDAEGLIPTYVSTRGELFEAEQRNIADVLLRAAPTVDRLLDDSYLRKLHRSMFDQVWRWAGTYRVRETNIGIDPKEISTAVRNLVDDARTWIDLSVDPDDVAVRFHHRLVSIHAFPNGNGRHGRIYADYLVQAIGSTPFTWGFHLGLETEQLRARYLRALRNADREDYDELLVFARS